MKKNLLLLLLSISLAPTLLAQVPAYVPSNGLVAWYPFSGNADDASSNALHGTLFGPFLTTDRYLNTNSAFAFSNTYIYVATNPLFNTSTGLTVSAWVNLSSPTLDQKIIGRTNTNFNSGFVLGVQNSQVYPEVWDNAGTHYTFNAGALSSGAWDHIVMTWQSGGYFVVYVNGTAADSIAASAMPIGVNTEPLIMGVSPWSQSPTFLAVFGDLDDMGLWNRALTSLEVFDLYQSLPQGIQSISKAENILVYPVPATTDFMLDLPGQDFELEVSDVTGRIVYSENNATGKTHVNCSALPDGIYFVQAENGKRIFTQKVSVQHD